MHKVLETALGRLILKHPFLSSILLSTEIEESETLPFTAATDGNKILFNMKKFMEVELVFVDQSGTPTKKKIKDCSLNEQINSVIFVLAHEGQHIALLHPIRMGNRDALVVDASGQTVSLWNLATDAVINEMLKKDGYKVLPGSVEYPGAEEKSAEEVYDEMLKNMKNNPKVKWVSFDDITGKGKEFDGKGKDGNSLSEGEKEMKMKNRVQKALMAAKAIGKLPASMERFVEKAFEPKVDWRDQLREAVTTITKRDDYTWSRLNRRYIWNNSYMPGFEGQQTGPIFLAFDTSGSIGGKELESFLSEMNSIFEECSPEKVSVGFCDSQFYSPHKDLEEDDFPMEPKQFSKITRGGGGTAFSPVFSYLKSKNVKPEMLIYFTDLYGSDFGTEPDYPVLWVSTGDTKAPFGKVIKLDL